jgi:outer membrane protein OmpA-like peptidoglycan-associated protein
MITRKIDGKDVESLYDPNVDNVLEGIAKLVGQFGAARVIIEGHTDGSLRGQVPPELVKELSMNRANSVREALVQKFSMEPNRFVVDGMGWDRPADAKEPFNHAKNRRVEVKVYPAEKQ